MSDSTSPFDGLRHHRPDGTEYWSAREIADEINASRWQRFEDAVKRAMRGAALVGVDVEREFAQASQVTSAGNLGDQARTDYHLSRRAAYLVLMNGSTSNPDVAAAQNYFATRTREAETAQKVIEQRYAVPGSFADALELAARQQRKIEQDSRKVAYVERFVKPTEDATLIDVMAALIPIDPTELRTFLRAEGILKRNLVGHRSSGTPEYEWRPTVATERERPRWFVVRQQLETVRRHNGQIRTTLYVTPVGQLGIANLLASKPVVKEIEA